MASSVGSPDLFSLLHLSPATGPTQGSPSVAAPGSNDRADMLHARGELLSLYRSLQSLAELTDGNARFRLDLPDAYSNPALSLNLTATAASLSSTGEINASPHSFSPFGPDWNDGSSAQITIGGEYDGSHGSGTISFEVRRAGTHGQDDLRIRVRDPQNNIIRNINIRDHHPEDREYDLRNGLFLTLGPGDLIRFDTTSIQVSQNTGSVFDPDRPLGGIRNQNPNFQYYPSPNTLPAVVDGSFLLNGESISVGASDTLNDVIARINQSSAGVTASYNQGTERIEFLQNTLGSQPGIAISGDTSNLVLSSKLDGAIVTPGTDAEPDRPLAVVSAFSGVSSGDVVLNGTPIAIDTANDSLNGIIDKINASSAGVVATFDASSQRVVLRASNAANVLQIDGNGTGLFDALNIPEGSVDAVARGNGFSRRLSYEIADGLRLVSERLNVLFQNQAFADGGIGAQLFRGPLASAVRGAAGADSGITNLFGLKFDLDVTDAGRGRLTGIDRDVLTRDLQIRGDEVQQFLRGADGSGGLLVGLANATFKALTNVNQRLGFSGTFVDVFA